MNLHIQGSSFFSYVYVICLILTLISLAFIGANRIRYADVQSAKDAKKRGQKSTKKAKDILTKALVEDGEEVFDY